MVALDPVIDPADSPPPPLSLEVEKAASEVVSDQPESLRRLPHAARVLLVLGLLYMFLSAIGLMGAGFKAMGKDFAESLLSATTNPFLGLFVGVLATSLVQSSSLTTAIVVGMVSVGTLSVRGAIPIIMGANIGTTVTNSMVSLGFAGDDEEFRRAFACSTVHDFFNFMCVVLLLPVELIGQSVFGTGPLEAMARGTATFLTGSGAEAVQFASPVKMLVKPAVTASQAGLYGLFGAGKAGAWACVLVSLVAVCVALWSLTVVLRSLLLEKLSHKVADSVQSPILVSVLVGFAVTVLVQSSSITTSLLVPLAAAGAISIHQALPITVGANIGTTVTALLASLGGTQAGLVIALIHLLFNVTGALIFLPYPLIRKIPVLLSRQLVYVTERSRWWAVAYVGLLFFGLPGLLLALV